MDGIPMTKRHVNNDTRGLSVLLREADVYRALDTDPTIVMLARAVLDISNCRNPERPRGQLLTWRS